MAFQILLVVAGIMAIFACGFVGIHLFLLWYVDRLDKIDEMRK